jgi:hypothetical protein
MWTCGKIKNREKSTQEEEEAMLISKKLRINKHRLSNGARSETREYQEIVEGHRI